MKQSTSRGLPDRMLKVEWRLKKGGVGHTFYYNNQSGYLKSQPRTKLPLGPDRAAALRKWAELEGAPVPPDQQTVGHAWLLYSRHERGLLRVAESTRTDYRRCWIELKRAAERSTWDDLTVPLLTQYLDRRSAKTRGNREMALLGILWNFALARGLTRATNLVPAVERNLEKPDTRYVTDAELAAVKAVASPVVCDALDLAYLTGQRPADVLRMKWADVRDGYLTVRQGKTGAQVAIAVTGEFAALLARIKARTVVSPVWILAENGRHPTLRVLRERFNSARAKSGVDFSLKHMRPKSASDTQEGATERLGHTTAAITKRVYRRLPTKAMPTK